MHRPQTSKSQGPNTSGHGRNSCHQHWGPGLVSTRPTDHCTSKLRNSGLAGYEVPHRGYWKLEACPAAANVSVASSRVGTCGLVALADAQIFCLMEDDPAQLRGSGRGQMLTPGPPLASVHSEQPSTSCSPLAKASSLWAWSIAVACPSLPLPWPP